MSTFFVAFYHYIRYTSLNNLQEIKRSILKNIILGILAHANTGKTTLSEALLFESGTIRSLGKVDKKTAFLDTHNLEKERGITIFSKQAIFAYGDTNFTLIDTPGHADFQAEMERSLSVLDYAILVVSAIDLITGHTKTLWELLRKRRIPTFIFVNKMDQTGADRMQALAALKKELSDGIIDYTDRDPEDISLCDEVLLNEYLETGDISQSNIISSIYSCRMFPCFFGSALKLEGVTTLLEALNELCEATEYGQEFGARVFKISRDNKGERLTFVKVTGGEISSKMAIGDDEKVNQLRFYSGDKFTTATTVSAGQVCAITGLNSTWAGQGLGIESANDKTYLEPVLSYALILPPGVTYDEANEKLHQLGEEDPTLNITYDEALREITIHVMGAFQTEILKSIIKERFDLDVTFGTGRIRYKETILTSAEGVGHFEPLRHYSEVHLLLEPGEPGEGIIIKNKCSDDQLAKNWQRLITTHIEERQHKGVLTGAPITDIVITLLGGRAHNKHTEGGDFRQATYRAIRQGLMQVKSRLLEPYYSYTLTIPTTYLGRALYDLEAMGASINTDTQGDLSVVTGSVPVIAAQTYQADVTAYTKGTGSLVLRSDGYKPCHNEEEVLGASMYDPERDNRNPSSSVFCAQGSSFIVPWDQVFNYMHLELFTGEKVSDDANSAVYRNSSSVDELDIALGTDEIDDIINKTFYSNKAKGKNQWKLTRKDPYEYSQANNYSGSATGRPESTAVRKPKKDPKTYFLVDGYNIIHAFKELNDLIKENLDASRGRLLDILSNFQAQTGYEVIAVFDAYKVPGHGTEHEMYERVHVVYTKEAETADAYIERYAHENAKDKNVMVATSDGLVQMIILGAGARLISAREFEEEIDRLNKLTSEKIEGKVF